MSQLTFKCNVYKDLQAKPLHYTVKINMKCYVYLQASERLVRVFDVDNAHTAAADVKKNHLMKVKMFC